MLLRNLALAITFGCLTLVGGCGKSNGEQFVGKWENQQHKETVEIAKNGDGFLVIDTHPNFLLGGTHTEKTPATYQNGMLEISSGFGTANIGYDKEHDTLLMPTTLTNGSGEFTRMK